MSVDPKAQPNTASQLQQASAQQPNTAALLTGQMNIPTNYPMSPDIDDRRFVDPNSWGQKIAGLVQAVKSDYHDSFPAPVPQSSSPYGPVIPARQVK